MGTKKKKDYTKYKMTNRKSPERKICLVSILKYSMLFVVKINRYFCGFPKCIFVPLVPNKLFQGTDFKGVRFYRLINCVGP